LASADIGFPVDADYGRELTAKKTTIEEAWSDSVAPASFAGSAFKSSPTTG